MHKSKSEYSIFEIVEMGVKLTPMMEQFYAVKQQFPDTLVLFRMGDFYELFFEDAKIAARVLNIALTHRGKLGDFSIPMSGIPHHAASTYIDKITACGMKAAICEQIEDPKQAKGIVKRAVTQVVSPGIPYDLEKISQFENKFIGSAIEVENHIYLSMIDFTTGEFFGMKLADQQELAQAVQIYAPKEFISYLGQWDEGPFQEVLTDESILKTHLSADYFDKKYTDIYLEKLIPGYQNDETLKAIAPINNAIGALAYYICSTQSLEELTHIKPFRVINRNDGLKVSYPTLVGLEILPKSREQYKESLLGHFDKTKSAMGARYLKNLFQNPLKSKTLLNQRLDAVESLIKHNDILLETRDELSELRDVDRIMAKLTTKKANGADLLNLGAAIQMYFKLEQSLKTIFPKDLIHKFSPKEKSSILNLAQEIQNTINDEIGANLDKGNLIKAGANKQRDKLAKKSRNVAEQLLDLESRYRSETGISNLKIKSNNVAGYFIEVSKSQTSKIPKSFTRRQTLVNSERYINDELDQFEKEIITAKEKLQQLERKIFEDLCFSITENTKTITIMAQALSQIDTLQCFAWMAIQEDLTRPELETKKKISKIEGAFHPLIKANLKDQFVPHNINLDSKCYFGLITGPNMAGKTTVMRELAIIQFLAQVGSFVPAKSATLGLCDYIFSRLGASDDIIKGRSTFMVEMSETAEIIRHATQDSLVILDEIGRGTSTYDGLSIAWSLVEYFVGQVRCRTLFSTHYHELIELVDELKGAKNLTVKTKVNTNGRVQFLYDLIEQGAGQSFGINVAQLAGLPKQILGRSKQILKRLEDEHQAHESLNSQLNFFEANERPEPEQSALTKYHEMWESEFQRLDIMNMTPIQAINKLHEMKSFLPPQ